LNAVVDRVVFISPGENDTREPSEAVAWLGRVVVSGVIVLAAVGAWWLFVPVSN
jgi:hypothetical protein